MSPTHNPLFPRKRKCRYAAFAVVEGERAATGRGAALGAIGTSAGGATKADGRCFPQPQVYPACRGERGGKAGLQPQTHGKFGADAARTAAGRVNCAGKGEPATAILQCHHLAHEPPWHIKGMVDLP